MTNAKHQAAWLALQHAPGLGARRIRRLLDRFGDAQAVCDAPASTLADAGVNGETAAFLRAPDSAELQADLAWLAVAGHHLVTCQSEAYPERLGQVEDAPPMLFALGDVRLLNDPQIAVVGARRPTPGGLENARVFAATLARAGLLVSSGLAKGVDTCAHEAALEVGAPTLAVVGTGLDLVYPAENQELAQRIARHGVLVSEFSCGARARPSHFPRRNRILSALSLGVLVIEAGARSGALITARLACEQGREVFATPGAIRNPLAYGCHRLIQQGAKLAQAPADVLEELGGAVRAAPSRRAAPALAVAPAATAAMRLSEEQRRLLDAMGYDSITVDELVERCALSVAEVSSMLLMLELEGCVASGDGAYTRVK